MEQSRYLVEAILSGARSPTELARAHRVSRSWIYELVARYRQGGLEAIQPRSKRPRACPQQVSQDVVDQILELRDHLIAMGFDAGPQTIATHLAKHLDHVPSVSTVFRVLKRYGLVIPQPHKRPISSWVRFEASLPNEMWQGDATHWHLADGSDVEILNLVDDHSRLFLASNAFVAVTAKDVVDVFHQAGREYGYPASWLSDNGLVFNARSRGGKVHLQNELDQLGIVDKHSRNSHPQTCGKVERLHQTLKKFLRQRDPVATIAELQRQLDAFRTYYNHTRPHRALGQRTPLSAYNARVKAAPAPDNIHTGFRVRRDRIDSGGKVTLRYLGKLRHIPVGRAFKHRRVRLLVADDDVRIIDDDGVVLRHLILDPDRIYQPLGPPTVIRDVLTQVSGMS